ncbi:MAG: sugar phosphate isomerase/epimerase [Cyclobacteriaceae bacterium]|nr:sugar phosphate isomerase/epimerase [Cyclobacteriaceae bacterium]
MNSPTRLNRRNLLKYSLSAPLLFGWPYGIRAGENLAERSLGGIKLSLNAYSFNQSLREGGITLMGLIDFCVEAGFDAIDPTGYYFPGYPDSPPDEYLYAFRRKAYLAGIEISGSGVRNDFTHPDEEVRTEGVATVKRWVDVCVKMGCPLLRVFPGKEHPEVIPSKATTWIIEHLKECADYAGSKGILLAMQNHNDFVKNSDQVIEILEGVNSEWLGLHLDIGSFEERDAYSEIERLIKYAFTWQLKELVWQDNKKVKTDFERLMGIIAKSGYRGYLPLETLGPGDPEKKVKVLITEVREAMEKEAAK